MIKTPILNPNDRGVEGMWMIVLMNGIGILPHWFNILGQNNTSPNPKQNSLNPNDRGVGEVSMLVLMNTNPNPKWTPYTLMIETLVLNPNDQGVSIIVLMNCIVTTGRHWFKTKTQNNINPNPKWTPYTLMIKTPVLNPMIEGWKECRWLCSWMALASAHTVSTSWVQITLTLTTNKLPKP